MKIGVFAGSFCPVTLGHVDSIEKAAKLVDKLYVVVGVNSNKSYAISLEKRLDMLKKAISHIKNADAVAYEGMMTDFYKQHEVSVMIKSIRNALDLQSVIDLNDVNESYWQGETVFVVGSKQFRHISSSLVRELAGLGQDFSEFVPQNCYGEIRKYLVR